ERRRWIIPGVLGFNRALHEGNRCGDFRRRRKPRIPWKVFAVNDGPAGEALDSGPPFEHLLQLLERHLLKLIELVALKSHSGEKLFGRLRCICPRCPAKSRATHGNGAME